MVNTSDSLLEEKEARSSETETLEMWLKISTEQFQDTNTFLPHMTLFLIPKEKKFRLTKNNFIRVVKLEGKKILKENFWSESYRLREWLDDLYPEETMERVMLKC